jgi:hypothetical protein
MVGHLQLCRNFVLGFVFVLLIAPTARATDISQCAAGLVANVDVKKARSDIQSAWLRSVTSQNYEQSKAQAGADYSYSGMKVFDGNYDQFNEKRTQIITNESFRYSDAEATDLLRSEVPDSARARWLECVLAVARSNFGLFVVVEDETASGATVRILWNSQPPPRQGLIESQTLTGALAEHVPGGGLLGTPLSIESGGSRIAILSRKGGREVRGAITVSGASEKFFIPAWIVQRSIILRSCGWGPDQEKDMGSCNRSAPDHFHFSQNDPSWCMFVNMKAHVPSGEVLVRGPVKFVYLGQRDGAKNKDNIGVEGIPSSSNAIDDYTVRLCGQYKGGLPDAWTHSDTLYRVEYQTTVAD